MKTKTCTRCNRLLPLTEFGKHKLGINGLNYWCKDCNRERYEEWRKTPSGIYSLLKSRAKNRRKYRDYHKVEISRDEFVDWYINESKLCAYCDIPEEDLHLIIDKYGSPYFRLTIDCKDNEAGYMQGNLALACDKCNITKSNLLTFKEMRYIGQHFVKPKWQALKGETAK